MEEKNAHVFLVQRTTFSRLVQESLIKKRRLTKVDLMYLASIFYSEAELLRRDYKSKRTVDSGLKTLAQNYLRTSKHKQLVWQKKINCFVEDGCLVIKD